MVRLWPKKRLPIVLPLGELNRKRAKRAMELWDGASTHVRLLERDGHWPYLKVRVGTNNRALVGWGGGDTQDLFLEEGFSVGDALHEIGHALGLHHEHTRMDRDDWIHVMESHVDPDWYDEIVPMVDRPDGSRDYDYHSVMHYPPKRGAVLGFKTFKPAVGKSYPGGVEPGFWTEPSPGDAHSLAILYR